MSWRFKIAGFAPVTVKKYNFSKEISMKYFWKLWLFRLHPVKAYFYQLTRFSAANLTYIYCYEKRLIALLFLFCNFSNFTILRQTRAFFQKKAYLSIWSLPVSGAGISSWSGFAGVGLPAEYRPAKNSPKSRPLCWKAWNIKENNVALKKCSRRK